MKWPIPLKIKELQFKIINGYYPTAAMLKKRFNFEVEPCVFCSMADETICNIYFSLALYQKNFGMNWLKIKMDGITQFTLDQILHRNNNLPKELFKIVNIIIVMGKCHIHKCKWKNNHPSLIVFKIDQQSYFASLSLLKN